MAHDPFAFVDEYGDSNLDTARGGTSGFFIVTAVLVTAGDLQLASTGLEAIRARRFQTGEMKSSSVAQDDERRERILGELGDLPFTFTSVVVDKASVDTESGLRFKPIFFKYVNSLLYMRLNAVFPDLMVYADEHGRGPFMESFVKYIRKNHTPDLFKRSAKVEFATAATQPLLQIADFVSGTLARYYDPKKRTEAGPAFLNILRSKATGIEEWPPVRREYPTAGLPGQSADDKLVRDVCADAALIVLDRLNEAVASPATWQRDVLSYLYFHNRWVSDTEYVSTNRLLAVLRSKGVRLEERLFRGEVIGALRDQGVIIAPSLKGYKLPVNRSDLMALVTHADRNIGPMLDRLKAARDKVLLASHGRLDILSTEDHAYLRNLLDIRAHRSYAQDDA